MSYGRPGLVFVILNVVCAGAALGNTRPATPVVTEPPADGFVANPEDVHMECAAFSDPDPGDEHACSDWEIWTTSPSNLVWQAACVTGVERLHIHLGDGVFLGSHAGRTSLLPGASYLVRVRHKDSSGEPGTEWSLWGGRFFSTGPASSVFAMTLDDVAVSPQPELKDVFGAPVNLPGGGTPASVRLDSAAGDLLLELRGGSGVPYEVLNPPALDEHVAVRIRVAAGAEGPTLALPECDLTLHDEHGESFTLYLPAVGLAAGQEALFWVSFNGSTYAATAAQTQPDFSTLARGPAVPWAPAQPGYRVDVVATGFQLPVNIAFVPNPAPGPSAPLFYVSELYGTIKVVRRDGIVGVYASNLINFNPTGAFPGSGEQGLAGICVDPVSGDVFAGMLYDAAPPNGPHFPKVVRFHSNDGGLTAATQTTILDMPGESQGQSHQISSFTIGPDGKLYVHMGDGFVASTAQNLDSYRGKILRLNLDGTAPADNPFYNAGNGINARDYVFAYGLRNPFGGAWRAADGQLYEVENGPSVDRIAKVVPGRNYLWSGSDANMLNFALYNWDPASGPVNMAFVQPETFGGSQFPAEKMGHMFISESGATWATGVQGIGKRISEFVLDGAGNLVSGPSALVNYIGSGKATCVGLAAGPDGLYFTDLYRDLGYSSPIDPGANILRVRFVGAADFTADVIAGPAPLAVQFSDTSSALTPSAWHWTFGDGGSSALQNPQHVYQHEGVYNVRLAVTTPGGLLVAQKNAFIVVGTTPRVALIGGSSTPAPGDAALANHLRGRGFEVTVFDDEPANRPSAAALGAQYDLVAVSSTILSGNVAGQFRTVDVPLVFCEQALLRSDREALADNGVVVSGATGIAVVDTLHPITGHFSAGPLTAFESPSNMSVGTGNRAAAASLLATRGGAPGDYALLACESGAALLAGYVAPARRVFFYLEDASWLAASHETEHLFDSAVCWALGNGPPIVNPPADVSAAPGQTVVMAAEVTSSPPATLQWRRNGIDIADGPRFSGAASPVLTITGVTAQDAGLYELHASAACGEATGGPVALSVQEAGDADCNGVVEFADTPAFVEALVDPAAYAANYPGCPADNSDMNADVALDGRDVELFVYALLN